MIGESSQALKSNRTRGVLWILASLPMIIGPVFVFSGNAGVIAVGVVFLLLGITKLRQHEES